MSLLSEARDLALRQHRGEVLSAADRQFIADVVDEVSPENFYMDGELFATES